MALNGYGFWVEKLPGRFEDWFTGFDVCSCHFWFLHRFEQFRLMLTACSELEALA